MWFRYKLTYFCGGYENYGTATKRTENLKGARLKFCPLYTNECILAKDGTGMTWKKGGTYGHLMPSRKETIYFGVNFAVIVIY